MRRTFLILACVAAAAAAADSAAQQSVYRWVDKDGNVHFTDTPPPAEAQQVTEKRVPGGAAAEETQLPYATQLAMKRNPVTLYSAPTCGEVCANGRTLLQGRGIPYAERNAAATPADVEELKKLIGTLEVPVLTVGATTLKGYSEDAWNSALDTAGYARALVPGQLPPKYPPPTPAAPASPTPATPAPATAATKQ
jgi:arsenate reductase-like glutaredoxin family protein